MSDAHDIAGLRRLGTEQSRPELAELDRMSAGQLVSLMCADAHRVPDAVSAAEHAIAQAVEGVVERLERGGRLIYVGAGTAGRLGMLDAAEAGPTFNVPHGQVVGVLAGGADAFQVSAENVEDDREGGAAAMTSLHVSADDVVVGIAASGRTPYVLGAVGAANDAGALTVGLACNAGTPLAALASIAIEALVGPEVVAGSTRLNAGTAQKVVLNVISTAAMVQLGKTYGGLMVDLRATNAKLRDRASRIVAEIAGVPLPTARDALERAGWRAKIAAAMLVGGVDAATAARVLERHRSRLRPALEELAPDAAAVPYVARESKRLGVSAAYVDGVLVRGDVSIAGDRISAVGLAGSGSGLAIPALVDAQVNGYAGVDVMTAEPEALLALGEALLRDGVIAYQPTLITGDLELVLAALRRIAVLGGQSRSGASIVGVHLEGPFLSPARAGAHPVEHLRAPSVELLERLLAAGPVRMLTLAPELPGALELIERSVGRGVVVSLGHSEASDDEAARAFHAGATAVTHLFNAMAPIAGRAPGLAGSALATDGVGIQLIADGVHVADELIRLAFAAAPGRCSLVTDAIAAAALGDGDFPLGEIDVSVRGGVARRSDGTLAGSTGRLHEGLARLVALGVDRAQAVAGVGAIPARLLGAAGFGRLARGGPAHVLVVDDALLLQRVVASGSEVAREG